MKLKKLASFILRTGLVAGCLVYAFWGTDFKDLFAKLANFDIWAVLGLFLFTLFNSLPPALRIKYLSGGRCSVITGYKAVIMGLGVNNVMPAKLGELTKAFYLRQEVGMSLSQSVTMVFWERFFDLNALLLMALCVAYIFKVHAAFYPLATAVGGIWMVLIFIRVCPDKAGFLIDLMPVERIRGFLADLKLQILHGIGPSFLAGLGLYTLVCWLCYSLANFITVYWLAGLQLSFWETLAVFVISSVAMAMPSSPGALGVFEASMVFALGLFGVDQETSLAAGVVLHMSQFIPTTLAGVTILAKSGLKLGVIKRSEEALDDEESGEA